MLRMNGHIVMLYYAFIVYKYFFLISKIYFENYTEVEAEAQLVSWLHSIHKIFGSISVAIK